MQHEVVSAEDRTFYTNKGIDPRGIARALYNNLRGGATQGGSTITQQYVKNYFLSQDRTCHRKFKEFFISIKIDRSTNKNAILQDYLNTIYFGRGAYGIQAASKAYFNEDVSNLTPAQGAVLASVIRAPALYDPALNPDRAKARWNYVMSGMVQLALADPGPGRRPEVPDRRSSARARQRPRRPERLPARRRTPRGREQAAPRPTATSTAVGCGSSRRSTRPTRPRRSHAIKDQMPTKDAKGVRVGLVSIKPGNGAVVAMYGGPNSVTEPFNAATQSTMQAGSTFKPFALITALGQGISLKSRFNGSSPEGRARVQPAGGQLRRRAVRRHRPGPGHRALGQHGLRPAQRQGRAGQDDGDGDRGRPAGHDGRAVGQPGQRPGHRVAARDRHGRAPTPRSRPRASTPSRTPSPGSPAPTAASTTRPSRRPRPSSTRT